MHATPPRFDLWLVAHLAMLTGRSRTFDLLVRQGVESGLLGGLWYAAALFVFWIQSGQPDQREVRRRTLTIALGSLVAALLTVLAARAVSWAPPSAHPVLAVLYPEDFPVNLIANSFPSRSTALYASVAAGIYSLRRTRGIWAWIGVGVVVALPRVYLGGHHLTDVLAGLVAGLGGYWVAILLETTMVSRCETAFEYPWDHWQRTLAECVIFLWIEEVAMEFHLVVWITDALASLWG